MTSADTLKAADLVALGVDEQHAKDWLTVRRAKKAPLTQTAWNALVREAEKAGFLPAEAVRACAENSWQSFQARYVADLNQRRGCGPQSFRQRDTAEKTARVADLTGGLFDQRGIVDAEEDGRPLTH